MILDVQNLTVEVKKHSKKQTLIQNISFQLKKDTCLGILGESGSGKSLTAKAIMGLLEEPFSVSGKIFFNGEDLLEAPVKISLGKRIWQDRSQNKGGAAAFRGRSIGMILQNPMTAFDPLFTIQDQMVETFLRHLPLTKREAKTLIISSLDKVHLHDGEAIIKKYPHELSGGMLQRIMIAMTLAMKPEVIIADEPTTAIDSINQIQVIKEFKRLRTDHQTAIIFITHDLGVLAELADEVIVMEKGKIVEAGDIEEIIMQPKEPYTKYLIDTRLQLLRQFEQALK